MEEILVEQIRKMLEMFNDADDLMFLVEAPDF